MRKKTEHVTARLTPDQAKKLRAIAEVEKRSCSDLIGRLIDVAEYEPSKLSAVLSVEATNASN